MLVQKSGGGGGQVGPQVNKFEKVSSDDHQMAVAGREVSDLMSGSVLEVGRVLFWGVGRC